MVRRIRGEVPGPRDVKPFEGRSPEELEESFRPSVDLYLEMCANDGVAHQIISHLKANPG